MVGSSASVSGAAKPSAPASPTNAIADYGAAPKPRLRKVALRAECVGEQAGQRWINSKSNNTAKRRIKHGSEKVSYVEQRRREKQKWKSMS